MSIRAWANPWEDEVLFAAGFEKAILGVSRKAGHPEVVAYDYEKCVQVLIDRDDMTEEEALEYLEFNVVGAIVGEGAPIFIEPHDFGPL